MNFQLICGLLALPVMEPQPLDGHKPWGTVTAEKFRWCHACRLGVPITWLRLTRRISSLLKNLVFEVFSFSVLSFR